MDRTAGRVPLFSDRREMLVAFVTALLLFVLHLAWYYNRYRDFVSLPFYYTGGTVLQSLPKSSASNHYMILKILTDDGMKIHTKTYRKTDLERSRVRLQLFPSERISFADYLRGPFVPSRIKGYSRRKKDMKALLLAGIGRQHADPEISAFYQSIYLATPIPQSLRSKISSLGSNHLVALSGFHLGILWGMIFFILRPVYRFLQTRYFPWRYDLRDIGSFALALLGIYLWLTGFPSSLLRSYTMLLAGWAALLTGIELLSFQFLAVITIVLPVIHPPLVLSLGFWLSVCGVFYIYLILHWTANAGSWSMKLALLPLGIYMLMLPVIHAIFPPVSPWQWLSPILSLLFGVFYPLSLLLHFFGLGNLFDGALQALWNIPAQSIQKPLPLWTLYLYLALSLPAIRFRIPFYALFIFSAAAAAYLYAVPSA